VLDGGTKLAEGSPRELIDSHIESNVVEVYGDNVTDWAAQYGRSFSERLEISGETAFCYTDSPNPLLGSLVHFPGLRYLHRPANLEDLFMKLTGREMRD